MISEVAALLSSPPLSTRCTDNSIEETPSWPDDDNYDVDDYSIIMRMMMMIGMIYDDDDEWDEKKVVLFSRTRLPKSGWGRPQTKLLWAKLNFSSN